MVFFKLLITGYLENITSDRKLVEHCCMRMDVLYFLGFDLDEDLPWHSTISRTRQLYPASLFGTLFNKVFALCIDSRMVSGHTQAVDSALIKAIASMESVVPKMPATSMEDHSPMFSGDISLTPRWKVGVSSGYDFKNMGFTLTQLRFERDLKSFALRFNWTPFGVYERWYFFIGIKSSILSDLKWDKNSE